MLLQGIHKSRVGLLVDCKGVGIRELLEAIVGTTLLGDRDWLVVVDAELEVALGDVVGHFAWDDGVPALAIAVPHIHLPSELELHVLLG